MKRNIIAPKRGKHKIFRAAASLTAAAAMLFFHVASAWAADDFITLRDAGRVDEKKAVGITLQLTDGEHFEESATFQVTFSLKNKDGSAVLKEDCSFVFDSGLSSTDDDAVVQDFAYLEDGKVRMIVSGRKNADGSGGILNKKLPLPLGKLAVTVRNQDVEITPVVEECKAVDERGILVAISDFGSRDAYVLKSANQTSGGSSGGSGGGGGSRRVGGGSGTSSRGPVETKGVWQQGANGTWLFLADSGFYAVDTWIYVQGKWYRMGADGVMLTGWYEENGVCYFLNANGAMETGWQLLDSFWYLFGDDGAMKTGWQKVNEKWYYLNPVRPVPQLVLDKATGVVLTDPVTFAPITTTAGQRAYGEMYRSTVTPDGYLVDDTGAWVN